MTYQKEIFLTDSSVEEKKWQIFLETISKYNSYFKKWTIQIHFQNNTIRYILKTTHNFSASLNGLKEFLLKETELYFNSNKKISRPYISSPHTNALDFYNIFKFHNKEIKIIEIKFQKKLNNKIKSQIYIYSKEQNNIKKYRIYFIPPTFLLTINFKENYNWLYKNAPKYLDSNKYQHFIKNNPINSIFQVDMFPYLQGTYYLEQNKVDNFKHSLIIGASGSGKSKFISSLISNLLTSPQNTRIIVIDPHASLEHEIGGLGRTIDFLTEEDSINLFFNTDEVIVSTELLLDIFKNLLSNNFNSKLERVLRHSIYLLLICQKFNFQNLRKLINDITYQNELIQDFKDKIPFSIIEFFLNDFINLKTKSYTEAISPIITFIDEMEMIPVFNKNKITNNLNTLLQESKLILFSLNRAKIGEKITKTIASLIMQQLLILMQSKQINEPYLFIIDEVAVVENPILSRFLSESRKYNVSLILAGQYFGGISEQLKKSIFANVVNYYMFRLSLFDANELVDSLQMKIPLQDTREEKIKMLSNLQNRECILRLSVNNCLLPAIKCKTNDYKAIPRKINKNISSDNVHKTANSSLKFSFQNNTKIKNKEILKSISTNKKVPKNE